MIWTKILFFVLIKATLQASTPSSPTYEAGVVELDVGSRSGTTSVAWMNAQLNRYLSIMDDAPSTLDIIVFPESTLNDMETAMEIPEPDEQISPCDDNRFEADNLVKKISCSAKAHQRYTVINLTTKVGCPDAEMIANKDPRNCSARPDGLSYYNTNVIFDRKGTVISRYRKFHLFNERVDRPYKPPMEYFDTDFGVRFGHFICFDIAFRYPALELVRRYDLTDVVYPTMWFSEFPYATAVQMHQNWAHANNVNMLAAGANNLPLGSTGTGIFGGKKGAYVSDMAGVTKTQLHTATVYKIKDFEQNEHVKIEHNIVRYTKEQMKSLLMTRDPTKDDHLIEFLSDIDGAHYHQKKVCENGNCCDIAVNYTIANAARVDHYQYAMAFFHGNRSFYDFAYGGVVACTVLACPTRNVSSCGTRNEALQHINIWNLISVEADLPTKDGQYLYMPTTLDNTITPLQPEMFEYETSDLGSDRVKIEMKMRQHNANLITFGLYGRDFTMEEGSGGAMVKVSMTLTAALMVVLLKVT